jgi:hemolysin activation/secretion protein
MRNSVRRFPAALLWACALAGPIGAARAQEIPASRIAPAPSQVAPPAIPALPQAAPQVPAVAPPEAPAFPEGAEKLSVVLLGFDIEGEFEEFVATRRELEAPLIGRRVTVAELFTFATKLQAAYVRAGYLLVRVVVVPQELSERARVKIKVIDGFIEQIDVTALSGAVSGRVYAVLEPLLRKGRLLERELERRLVLAGDTPGLELRSTLAAGKEVGGSILILTGLHRPVTVSAYSDNAMPVTFGTTQAVGLLGLNSVFGAGEQIFVSATDYPKSDFATMFPTRRFLQGNAVAPLGIDSWRVLFTATDGRTTPSVPPVAATQGIFRQSSAVLAYDAIRTRDIQLTVNARLDLTNERVDTLVLNPPVSLSLDRVRPVRAGVDGNWRLRDTDTNIIFTALVSRGLAGLGARTLADATPELPLSRQGADAVFTKLNAGFGIMQNLPSNFLVTTTAYAQSSFHRPLLTSEQFDIVGPKMLSGFTAGSLPGDSAWVVRTEFGHVIQVPFGAGAFTVTRYVFGATGERIFHEPTALEFGSVHASNYGVGIRFVSSRWAEYWPNSYSFIEASRRTSTNPALEGWRAFGGILIQY